MSWIWPVAASTETRSRPDAPETTAPIGGATGIKATRAMRAAGVQPTDTTTTTARATPSQGDVQDAGTSVAESNRQGLFPDRGIGRDVAQVVDDQQGHCQCPDATRHHESQPRPLLGLDVGRPHRGHETEEHEHADLAEAAVSIRRPSACVVPGRRNARRAHREQPPLRRQCHDRQARKRTDPEADAGGALHRLRRSDTGCGEPHGPYAFIIGSPYAVAVVVREVDGHLKGERDDQRQEREHRVE